MLGKEKPIKVITIGDSLTQGNPPPNSAHPGKYQHFMVKILQDAGYKIDEWNYGIGGQIAMQISARVSDAVNFGDETDIISIMAGTNDCWRFTNFGDEVSADMREDVLENLVKCVNDAKAGKNSNIKIVLCSIPATRITPSASEDMLKNIQILRDEIEELANKKGVYFCDVYNAFLDGDNKANKNYVIQDGVHFTPQGNEACGKCIGEKILEILNSSS